MSILDFKEIPEANKATGNQDLFELFAREFLSHLEYRIIVDPNRGPDGGKDIVVEEKRTGVGGETIIKWLVSCKHKAHSGKSTTIDDELDILDRVQANQCKGFIGFYSTLPSASLSTKLIGLREKLEVQTFDREKIERELLHSIKGIRLAERYFPLSCKQWRAENPVPAKIFAEKPSLKCKYCQKELLDPKGNGIIVFWKPIRDNYETEPERVEEIYWRCKGHCDLALAHSRRGKDSVDSWEDIPDVMIPLIFIKWVITPMNNLREGTVYSDHAFDQFKTFIINIYPFVARHQTENEKEQIQSLMQIPSFLGGLGS